MRASDARALRNYINEIEPDVIFKQLALCSHCSVESEVLVPMRSLIFLA
jgi:hypothetical protein